MNEPPPIDELIRAARAGDPAALQGLLERYRHFVGLVVRCKLPARLQTRVDGSDIIQETMLCAAKCVGQFHGAGEAEWRAWLGRIAEHEVIRQVRHHVGAEKRTVAREAQPAAHSDGPTGSHKLDGWLAAQQSTPSMAAIRSERAVFLSDALARLPTDYREVLVLRHLEGLEFEEVARRMGRTSGAVRVLWTRALKRLRETVGDGPETRSK